MEQVEGYWQVGFGINPAIYNSSNVRIATGPRLSRVRIGDFAFAYYHGGRTPVELLHLLRMPGSPICWEQIQAMLNLSF